jgi:hypothetical protein
LDPQNGVTPALEGRHTGPFDSGVAARRPDVKDFYIAVKEEEYEIRNIRGRGKIFTAD